MGRQLICNLFSTLWSVVLVWCIAKLNSCIQFLNSALYFILGVHPSEVSKEAPLTSDEFVKSFHDALVYSMFRTLLGKAWSLFPQANYIKTCATAHNFIDYYIEQALHGNTSAKGSYISGSGNPSKRSLIQVLSSQTDDQAYIRYQVIQSMMAAQDTTSELLTNSLFLLARHPDYWQRLCIEVVEQGDDFLQVDKFMNCKLIEYILLESKLSTPHYRQ